MRQVRIGFSGFATPALRARFFQGVAQADLLPAYAQRFGCYELAWSDHTDPATCQAFARTAPPGLRLLPRHPTHAGDAWFDAMAPILQSRDCGPVLLPCNSAWSPAAEDALGDALTRLWDHLPARGRVAVEFRDRSWFRAGGLRVLEEHEATLVWSTAAGLAPYRITADTLYVRLTGRAPRGGDEVRALLARLRERPLDGREVFVVSTLPAEGYGVRALERMAHALGVPFDAPAPRDQAVIEDYATAY